MTDGPSSDRISLSYRAARLFVLSAWTFVLLYLTLFHQTAHFLGSRTAWVVPVGALALLATTITYATLSRDGPDARRRLGAAEIAGTAAMLVPVAMVFVLSSASLGALAASRKLGSQGIKETRINTVVTEHADRVGFLEIGEAGDDHNYARANRIVPGRRVHVTGLVLKAAPRPGAPFGLGRFYITCCVADSLAIDTTVLPGRGMPQTHKNQWLSVAGTLVRRGHGLAIRARRVTPIAQPKNPYLDFYG